MKSVDELVPGAAFWREAFALRGATTRRVLGRTLVFALVYVATTLLMRSAPWLAIRTEVMEVSGVMLGLLLVFRSAAGYERWWEARRLWGGILNQSRNLVRAGLSYGPVDRAWQDDFARWVAVFAHVARGTLRDQRVLPEVAALLGEAEATRIGATEHMPSHVAGRIAAILRRALETGDLDRFAFLAMERERMALLDHVGGCERILKTPIPEVYSVTIRRFVVLYLCALPFAFAAPLDLLSPAYAILIAYSILSLEQLGAELQNPFVIRSLSHLDLGAFCTTIERELRAAAIEHAGVDAGQSSTLAVRPPAGTLGA